MQSFTSRHATKNHRSPFRSETQVFIIVIYAVDGFFVQKHEGKLKDWDNAE